MRIVAVDSQKLNGMQECMRKFNYSFTKSMEPIIKPDFFERGDLIHRMLQVYYNCRKYRTRWPQNNKTHADIMNSCIKVGRTLAVRMSLSPEDVEEVINTFREYAIFTAEDGWDQIRAVEQVGSKILYQSDDLVILYEFKIDLIISLSNCVIMPVDHKSGSRRQDPSKLSNQFLGYCWGLSTDSQPVNNITINKIGFQKTLKGPDKFQRYIKSYSEEDKKEWVEESVWWITQGLHLIDNGLYPRNLTSCDKYSGCIFKEVCSADRTVREYKLRSLFDSRTNAWDVGADL